MIPTYQRNQRNPDTNVTIFGVCPKNARRIQKKRIFKKIENSKKKRQKKEAHVTVTRFAQRLLTVTGTAHVCLVPTAVASTTRRWNVPAFGDVSAVRALATVR